MKVQLAYRHDDHEPDDVVDLDDVVARRLIADGRARVPDETKTTSKTSKASKTSKSTSVSAEPLSEEAAKND